MGRQKKPTGQETGATSSPLAPDSSTPPGKGPEAGGTSGPSRPEAFTRREPIEGAAKASRMSFKLTEAGTIDWDSMQERTRLQLETLLKSDVRAIAISNPQAVNSLGLVTEKHMEGILHLLSYAERYVLPPIIEKQTGVKLSPQVKAQALTFTPQEIAELCPPGAATANELLPIGVQQWIVKGSNCGQFFGGLAMCMMQHAALALALQAQENERFGVTPAPAPVNKPNGTARGVDLGAQPETTEKTGVQG